ncbi:leucyl aminopeptidase [Aeromicrobium chenweiae]|uniref:Probable cytosol aminopeptidase n=1 Tax=Aeromicrobium chenweiae TaxID=2079793 RepID=A0A2S0WKZ8_9ACTN|nr:leucyl aminopeptidase [Aeromicrobium chenweiae]AWB91944.1 leucyl aminopeptidase [Aeromicrobium chenweiae]TGN32796.1 leucyl aminopeptidase [Aeromicrobium chenweiae]
MPTVTLSTSKPTTASADVLILGIRSDEDKGELSDVLDLMGFSGEKGQTVRFPSNGLTKAPVVVAVALPQEPTAEDLRRAAANGVRAAKNATSVAVALHPAGVDEVEAVAEGIGLGTYRYEAYKTKKKKKDSTGPELTSAVILSPFARQTTATRAVERAATVAEAVNAARDWVNTPPGDKRPADLVEAFGQHAGTDVKVTVWDEKRLAKERCGGILGVGRGSDSPPRLMTLSYEPEGAVSHLALVGKGITFDSGGLSIKPGASMQTMKLDMAGAAAIVAATVAIARLGLPIKVTAYACVAENMPSGGATRPGDVLHMRSGATVEVHNTDAEGRLVLADGLALAVESGPDHIVDVATLTGACIVALGQHTSGVLSNDDAFAETVLAASQEAGESMWRLPITEEMKGVVTSSSVGDLRQHNPKPYGGALFAAAFLREFVGDVPWAHLDIAGPSFNEGGAFDYTPVGGTGTGVRTLVRLATELAGAR